MLWCVCVYVCLPKLTTLWFFQVEIDGRKDVFKKLQKFGNELVASDHFAKQTIQQNLETLSEIENKVKWRKQFVTLLPCDFIEISLLE